MATEEAQKSQMLKRERRTLEDLSAEDYDRLKEIIIRALPSTPERRDTWLEDLLISVDSRPRHQLMNRIMLGGSREDTAVDIVLRLKKAGGPAEGRTWFGFFLRRFANSLTDMPTQAYVLGLFEHYALDMPITAGESASPDTGVAGEVLPSPEATREATWEAMPEATREPLLLGAAPPPATDGFSQAALSVARIAGMRGAGTGFLVGKNLVMTANFVVESRNQLTDTALKFMPQMPEGSETLSEAMSEAAFVGTPNQEGLFYASTPLQYSVFAIHSRQLRSEPSSVPPPTLAPLPVTPAVPSVGQTLAVIHYPYGRARKIDVQEDSVLIVEDATLTYLARTQPGSAGAPILTSSGVVTAVHLGSRAPGSDIKSKFGVRMTAILADLKANAPEIYDKLTITA